MISYHVRGEVYLGGNPKKCITVMVLGMLLSSTVMLITGAAAPISLPPSISSGVVLMGDPRLEWEVDAIKDDTSNISTPALSDLDGDGRMEIVVVSADGNVNVIRHGGSCFWGEPFQLGGMDLLGVEEWTRHGSLRPPEYFPSPLVGDVVSGDEPELLIAGGDGLYCIGANGRLMWRYEVPNGSIFNTPTLVDLEGGPKPTNKEMEIVFARDNENRTTELVILKGNGTIVLQQNISLNGDTLNEVSASIVAEDLDGAFWENGTRRLPGDGEEISMELVIARYGYMEVYDLKNRSIGPKGGYARNLSENLDQYLISTPAVANVDPDQGLEMTLGRNRGSFDWNDWGSDILLFKRQGGLTGDIPIGSEDCAIIGSPAFGDLQGTAYSSWTGDDIELVFGSGNGMLYVANSATMTQLWSFDTGGALISSPALCDIDHDRELEIIVASESGKIFCLDGDPSDGVDEGAPYPGDCPTQDVLWVYDADTTFGISSPVVADIDRDGVLEVVIGTTDGRVLCLSAGGRSLVGQADWPTFHGNNGRTGYYYNYPTKWVEFGPKIDENEGPEPLLKSVSPGSLVGFNLSVLLEGQGITEENRQKIMVHIDRSTVPPGWSAWLDTPPGKGNDNPEFVMLASQEAAQVTFWVYAPWDEDFGEIARIDVDAYLETNTDDIETVSCIAVLNLFNDLEVFFLQPVDEDPLSELYDKKWNTIDPGNDCTYTIVIRNTGNMNDSYELTLSEPPIGAGWNWYFMETGTLNASVSLTAQLFVDMFGGCSGATFTVAVEASPNAVADSRIPIVVKGISKNMMGILQKTDEIILVVGSVPGLSLVAFEDRYEITDEKLTISLGITNTGNIDPLNVLLSVEGLTSAWGLELLDGAIPIKRGQMKRVQVTITPPSWIHTLYEAGTEVDLTFFGVAEGLSLNSSVSITLVIPRSSGLIVGIHLPDELDLAPCDSMNATLKLSSRSNFDEAIEITPFDIDSSLEVELTDGEGALVDTVHLGMFEDVELLVHVKVREDADAGSQKISFWMTPEVNVPIVVSFTVNVTGVGDIKAKFLNGGISKTDNAPIREVRKYTLEVTNDQNARDLIHVLYGKEFTINPVVRIPPEEGWHAAFKGISRSLGPDVIETISMSMAELASTELRIGEYLSFPTEAEHPTSSHELVFMLGRGETAYIDIIAGGDSGDGSYLVNDIHLRFLVRSEEWSGSCLLSLDLDLTIPDLAFDGNGYSLHDTSGNTIEQASEGEGFVLVIDIINMGDAATNTTWMNVHTSDSPVQRIGIGPIGPGQKYEVIVPMDLAAGEQLVSIHIDPDNSVHELRDQFVDGGANDNNRMTIGLSVEREYGHTPILLCVTLVLLVLLICMVLLLVGLVVIRRRPRNGS